MNSATAYRVERTIAECLTMNQDLLPIGSDPVTEDSLEKIEIAFALEEEFGIDDISDAELENVRSLEDWVELVEAKRGKVVTI